LRNDGGGNASVGEASRQGGDIRNVSAEYGSELLWMERREIK
jgi:hypothetical protein